LTILDWEFFRRKPEGDQEMSKNQQATPADYPSFLREEVVGVLGPCPALKDSIFVRRRHIMEAYGLSAWTFRQLVMSKRLTPKHFVFRETVVLKQTEGLV